MQETAPVSGKELKITGSSTSAGYTIQSNTNEQTCWTHTLSGLNAAKTYSIKVYYRVDFQSSSYGTGTDTGTTKLKINGTLVYNSGALDLRIFATGASRYCHYWTISGYTASLTGVTSFDVVVTGQLNNAARNYTITYYDYFIEATEV